MSEEDIYYLIDSLREDVGQIEQWMRDTEVRLSAIEEALDRDYTLTEEK